MDDINSVDIYNHLKCTVCNEFCDEAVECITCSTLFCKKCLINNTCTKCRKISTFRDSLLANKLISTIPTTCKYCGASSVLKSHTAVCPKKPISCNAPNCGFKGTVEQFQIHLNESHIDDIIKSYDKKNKIPVSKRDLFAPLSNKKNIRASRGESGKFYCAKKNDIKCVLKNCCDGNCGPDNGCNCTACIQLDKEFYQLEKNQMLNKMGVVCQLVNNSFYCGGNYFVNGKCIQCAPGNGNFMCMGCSAVNNPVIVKFLKDTYKI